ncbi:MAG: tyrosine-type recombinase/integrase [Methylococcales bacterium]
MATISKTPEGTWRALVCKKGWPCTSKNFRTKRDAQDWARRIEDEMVRGAYIQRSASEQTTLSEALDRYLKEFTPLKKFTTQVNEKKRKDGIRRAYTINKVWEMALKRAKITGLRFHDLRHEAVSRLVEKGLSDQEVSAVSGHKSMQMLKLYTHLRAEDLVKKLDAVD